MFGASIDFEFSGEIWYWRGPAPFFFVTVPEEESRDLKVISSDVTYGWGVIPVRAQIGKYGVENVAVSQRQPVPCADQGDGAQGGTSRRR